MIETDRYKGVVIDVTTDSNNVATSRLDPSCTPVLVSSTKTFYDEQGRVIETVSPSGLRTGTAYYSDGSVEFTGTLDDSAPDDGNASSNATTGVTTYGRRNRDQHVGLRV